ncbi:hybrid sensor histidine kinase/response regulator [Hymenobacter sediminicola]|uniref:Sensory/regulatory protein RpfC n=1 Tax=Hymenobacter sediminicola TaxID=2761579 RepID=A0A7G7W9K0_9BACT|nr:hybrid sensor histidine kinase/response regulator [Hymenobacter sediminicola]QNH63043.1 response regulator [Hymenobacter sediminicola]
MLLLRVTVLLALLLAGRPGTAQTGQPQQFVKHFGAAEGLPQPFIYALTQDRQGYLWIGTAEGLVRYDGTEFITYTTKDGLAEDFVTQLYVQPRTGQLWAAHYQGGASYWTGRRFQALAAGAARPKALRTAPGIPAPDTTTTAELPLGLASRLPTLQQVLPTGTIPQCQFTDREHTLWIGTAGQGLWRWSDRHISFYPTPASSQTATLALLEGGRTAGISASGEYFTLNPTAGLSSPLFAYPPRLLPYSPSVVLQTPSERTNPIFDGRYPTTTPQMLWAGTQGHGLWQKPLPSGQQPMRRVRRLPPQLSVTALAQHPNGDLWIGTALDGVYRLPADTMQAAEHFTTANGLLHNTIYALATDSAGRVWLGTHDTGLAFWQRGRFHYFRFRNGAIDVSSLLTDDAGRVWIGTEGSGVLRYEKGKLRPYTTTEGLLSPYCYTLLPVRWGANYHGGYRYDFRAEQVLAIHRNGLSFLDGSRRRFRPAALPNNPLVRELLPMAAVAWNDYCVWIQTRTGLLCVRTNYPALLPSLAVPAPAITGSEVNGDAHDPQLLGQLPATRHRMSFAFRAVSLLAGPANVQYQYRLRGYDSVWSKPSAVTEAQFPRLDAGDYVFEVHARRNEQSPWSQPAAVSFGIATPFWRTWWFATLSVLMAGAGIWAVVRGREAVLRQQKMQLETTVRERTQELRKQKAHIEEMNAELTVARDVAEASRKAKAQFLANMSHEIRTPMNAVIGLSHLLRQTPLNGEQSEYLEAVQSSSQNLLIIINDILDSSKIEAGKMTLEHTAFRLPELLRRVTSMFRFATESKHLYLRLNIAPEVPAAVLGDPVRLNQVLVNLIGNAVKFTTTGGVTVHVSVPDGADTDQPTVHFAVQDTGIGIPAGKLDAIFEDFSQANTSTTRQFGGTGLGLSIARNLVELHGGQLWVESEDGVGSVFAFAIRYPVADPTTVPAEASLAVGRFEPALRVLVAEDNEMNQLVARKTLEAWNVHVTVAANGRLAVQAAESGDFDAVLMDVQMPEMDGYEASRQLRALFPAADTFPIIGLTASALPEDRILALEAGMNDTLAKPFDPALLFSRLAQYTGRATVSADSPAPATYSQSPTATESLPSLDWSILEELAGGNEAFIQQIINIFLTHAPTLQQQLRVALSTGDRPTLASTAHKLKGQTAYFGVDALHTALENLEQQAKQEVEMTVLTEHILVIDQQLDWLYPLLRARIAAAGPT